MDVKVYLGLHTITEERPPNERLNISSFKVHELYGKKKTGNSSYSQTFIAQQFIVHLIDMQTILGQ